MLSPLRNRFGIPGVISVIALVFAMLGGAYAANDSGDGGDATASAKKKNKAKKGPRGPRGKRGPAGPAGPAGAAGAQGLPGAPGAPGPKGDKGDKGSNGSDGTDGASVTSTEFDGFGGSCTEGGVEFESASPEPAYACNGSEGSPWTAGGTLPSGATQTGSWFLSTTTGSESYTAISFPIPLSEDLDGAHVKSIAEGAAPPAECDDGVAPAPSPANPEADPGYLCIYTTVEEVTASLFSTFGSGSFLGGASTTGAILSRVSGPNEFAFGTWAVTG